LDTKRIPIDIIDSLSNGQNKKRRCKMDPETIWLLKEILQEFGHELKKETIKVIVKKAFEYLRNKKVRE
jgi:bifunctional DNase/RNase